METGGFIGDRLELGLLGAEDNVRFRVADERPVCWNDENGKAVDLLEFFLFRFCRPRHATDAPIELKVMLEGDLGEGLRFSLNRHALFGL